MNQKNPREQRTPSPLVHIELSPAKKTPRKLRTPFKTPSATTHQLQPDSTPKTLPSKLTSPDSSNTLLPPHIPAKRAISNDNSLPKGTTTPHRDPTSEATSKSQNTPLPPTNNSRQIDDLSQKQKSQRNAGKNNIDMEIHQHQPPVWPPRTPLSMIISTSQPDAEKAVRGNASSSTIITSTTNTDNNTASTPRRAKSEFIRGTPRKLLHVANTTCTIGEEVDDFRGGGGGGGGGGGENSMIFQGPRKLRVSSMVRKINEDEKRERRAPPKLRRKGEATAIATA